MPKSVLKNSVFQENPFQRKTLGPVYRHKSFPIQDINATVNQSLLIKFLLLEIFDSAILIQFYNTIPVEVIMG